MRKDLSSKIALTHVSDRLYKPSNMYEESVVTRYEKLPTHIYASIAEAADKVATSIANDVNAAAKAGKHFVMAIAGGVSPIPVLDRLVEMHKQGLVSFKHVHIFPAYEFYPLPNLNVGCVAKLKENFLNHVDVDSKNIYTIDVTLSKEEVAKECVRLEETLTKIGGIDTLLIGIGAKGTIGVNLPGSVVSAPTRLAVLDQTSRKEAARNFVNIDIVPSAAITLGLATINAAKKVYLVAWGEEKAQPLKDMVEGPTTDMIPASLLQEHSNTQVFCDLQAASFLTRIHHPWLVTSCEWTDQLIRRAIVWLCKLTNKPILKLTNKDYSENQLGELIVLFGSAYNVNIRIFNDIQHTITGWPGGKPNADDSNRPERALPNPKKVIIFSPHPDDDVISMGGTFRRLVAQGHDVHVAYQTSGNIAVGDEEVIRYLSYLRNVCEELGMQDSKMMEQALKLRHFLLHEKEEGSIETKEVRFMKGTIRREEARTACRFVGIPEDHVHFLDLPFYETGAIKKGELTQKDIDIVIDLLEEVKPDQIFVAGDLADPHGTHKVCLDAALAAMDQIKHETWFQNCWIWMYRGAWAEWEIDHIEMAVPISPEELRFKRNSILKHQSQMDAAPFLGDDERLFWQRAEERNRATAELYRELGLASYEAMEAFVRYHPIPDDK